MGSVILISTAAIIVAIVGCFVIWRLDASRADEIEHQTAPAAPTIGRPGSAPSRAHARGRAAADAPAPPSAPDLSHLDRRVHPDGCPTASRRRGRFDE